MKPEAPKADGQKKECTCRKSPGSVDTNWTCPIHGNSGLPEAQAVSGEQKPSALLSIALEAFRRITWLTGDDFTITEQIEQFLSEHHGGSPAVSVPAAGEKVAGEVEEWTVKEARPNWGGGPPRYDLIIGGRLHIWSFIESEMTHLAGVHNSSLATLRAEIAERRAVMADIVRAIGHVCTGLAHDELVPEIKRQLKILEEKDANPKR